MDDFFPESSPIKADMRTSREYDIQLVEMLPPRSNGTI